MIAQVAMTTDKVYLFRSVVIHECYTWAVVITDQKLVIIRNVCCAKISFMWNIVGFDSQWIIIAFAQFCTNSDAHGV